MDEFVSSMRSAIEQEAIRAQSSWLVLIGFSAFLGLSIIGQTDEHIFWARPIELNVMSITMDYFGFFAISPILLAIFFAFLCSGCTL